jgi:septum formation protein
MDTPKIILASKSARRIEILTHLGLKPKVVVSDANEDVSEVMTPEQLTEELSLRKAGAVLSQVGENQLVIASDTVVSSLTGEIFGKPKDKEDAFRMLTSLSGTTHRVVSGIALYLNGKTAVSHDITYVKFKDLTEREINAYISTAEPYDKAGGYGIQDKASVFVEKIDGDFYNVVGLPVYKMFDLMKKEFDLDYFDLVD